MDIKLIMERNAGKLFEVRQERLKKDDQKLAGYYSEEEGGYGYGNHGKPIFKIKWKPRNSCHLH